MNIAKYSGFLLFFLLTFSFLSATHFLEDEEPPGSIKNHLGLVIQDPDALKHKMDTHGLENLGFLLPYIKKGGHLIFVGSRETLATIFGLCAAGTVFYCVTPLALPLLEKGALYALCSAGTTPLQYSVISVTSQSIIRFVVPSSLAYMGGRLGESLTRTSLNVLAKATKVTLKGLIFLGAHSAHAAHKALRKKDVPIDEDDFFFVPSNEEDFSSQRDLQDSF